MKTASYMRDVAENHQKFLILPQLKKIKEQHKLEQDRQREIQLNLKIREHERKEYLRLKEIYGNDNDDSM